MSNVLHSVFPLEVKRAGNDAGTMSFTGYGAVFNNVDAYGDVIAPGAFAQFLADTKSGKQPWPAMLNQHGGWGMSADDLTPVGVWSSLSEDGTGLAVDGTLAPTPRGQELYALMKMGPRPAIDGLSIGYIPQEWDSKTKPDDPRRTLKRIDLVEISPVTFPANKLARVGDVKRIEALADLPEIEDLLREAGGFSRAETRRIVSVIRAVAIRDSAPHLKREGELISFLKYKLSRDNRG